MVRQDTRGQGPSHNTKQDTTKQENDKIRQPVDNLTTRQPQDTHKTTQDRGSTKKRKDKHHTKIRLTQQNTRQHKRLFLISSWKS